MSDETVWIEFSGLSQRLGAREDVPLTNADAEKFMSAFVGALEAAGFEAGFGCRLMTAAQMERYQDNTDLDFDGVTATLRHKIAKLTAERDAARAEVERLRGAVEREARFGNYADDFIRDHFGPAELTAFYNTWREHEATNADPRPVVDAATDSGWPRWWHLPDSGCVHRADGPDAKAIWYRADGTTDVCVEDTGRSMITHERFYKPMTPAEAAAWLRANGHPGVADEMEKA